MRNLSDVIHKMLIHIPDSMVDLKCSLGKIAQSSNYAPPEMQSTWWNYAYEDLVDYVFTDDFDGTGWREQVRKIWVGEV